MEAVPSKQYVSAFPDVGLFPHSGFAVELDGAVEYKSLPSGLHNVKEDLMYAIALLLDGLANIGWQLFHTR